jgi:hypothetical protein
MSSTKKIDLQRYFAAGVYLSEAGTPYPPLRCCIRVYSIQYLLRGGGGRVDTERRGEGQQGRVQSQSWVENTIAIKIKTCRKDPLQVNFFR